MVQKRQFINGHKDGALPRDVIKIPSLAGGKGSTERYFLCHTCNSKLFPPSEIEKHRSHNISKTPNSEAHDFNQEVDTFTN